MTNELIKTFILFNQKESEWIKVFQTESPYPDIPLYFKENVGSVIQLMPHEFQSMLDMTKKRLEFYKEAHDNNSSRVR